MKIPFASLKNKLKHDTVLSSILITVATTAVKLVAAIKEIAVAHRFGIGDDLDAFLIAYLFATFTITIFSVSFASAIIPTYVHVKEKKGPDEACELFCGITSWSLVFVVAIVLLLIIVRPIVIPVLGSGFDTGKMAKTMSMAVMLLPILLFWGISIVWGAVLNAHKKFLAVALSPAIISLTLIASIVLGAEKYGIFALVAGTLAGHLIELVVIGYSIRREGLPLVFRLNGISGPMKRIISQYLPLGIAALMSTGMGIVDQAMAGMLASGSVSALSYGYRLVGILFSLSASLWIVALPHFSRLVSERDYTGLKKSIDRYCSFALATTIPLAILLILTSPSIVKLVFEHGAFVTQDTIVVARIQRLYLMQYPFFVTGMVIMRMFSSLNKNSILMWGGAMGFFLNVGFNLLFVRMYGISGIALSTAAVSFCSFCFLFSMMRYSLKTSNLVKTGD